MTDIIIIASILTTVIAGMGAFIARLHIKRCSAGCINSDCVSPPSSPPTSPTPSLDKEIIKTQPRGLSRIFRLAKKLNELELEATKEDKLEKTETTI